MIQLLTLPRSICAALCVPTLGAQVLRPVFFHWGFKLSRMKRKGNTFFRVEEIIDFQSYSYLFLLICSVFEPALYRLCLTSVCLPGSHYSNGLEVGTTGLLPSRGYLAISGHIFFVTAGVGCCYWCLIGRGHRYCSVFYNAWDSSYNKENSKCQ